MNIGIVGAGATGLAAGYELVKNGHRVAIYEEERDCGGLAGTIDIGPQKLEKFYHHIFKSDSDMIGLIDETGLSSKLMWLPSKSGIYIDGKLLPFTSAKDLLAFSGLSLTQRLSLGLLAYRARFEKNWHRLENISAKDWIMKCAGADVYEKVWNPLLQSKFDTDAGAISAAWLCSKLKLRGSTRSRGLNTEILGYMKGSFGMLYDSLASFILKKGGRIWYSHHVNRIVREKDGLIAIYGNNAKHVYDAVIYTSYPGHLPELCMQISDWYTEKIRRIRYKANICMVMELAQQLSPYYWISVAERDFPFVGVIEHTNLVSTEEYNEHVVYLSRYIDEDDELFSCPDSELEKLFIRYLKKIFDRPFEPAIKNIRTYRARYTQPVVCTGYRNTIPEYRTPVENLYLACMAQIYPEDRGQNYAVKMGRDIACLVHEKCSL